MKTIYLLLFTLFLFKAPLTQAETCRFVFGGSLTFGGDTVGDFYYEDGSSDQLKSGGLFYMFAGADFPLTRSGKAKSGILSTIGYHFDSVNATNGDAYFQRLPIDISYYYQPGRLGYIFGATYHLSPELGVNVPNSAEYDIAFDDSLGAYFEIFYEVSQGIELTFRGTQIEYEYAGNNPIDGSFLSLGFRHKI